MINSLTRPLFYDENGQIQKVGEKVWDISRKGESYITIKCPYQRSEGTVVPEITENDFFSASDVTAEYSEYEDDSVQVIFIEIKRPTTFAYKYWTADWDGITFKNCAQNDDYYSRTEVDVETVRISAEVGGNAASVDGYVSIVIPDVHSTVLSTPGSASQEAYNFNFGSGVWGRFYGTFNGYLNGTAHKASQTNDGHYIGKRWYYTVVQVKYFDVNTGGHWYITFNFPSLRTYSSTSITLENIYDAFKDLGFLYDTTTDANKSYEMTAMPVSVTNPIKSNNVVPRIYSGMAFALTQPVDNGIYRGFVISYMDETGLKEFEMQLGYGSIVYFKQYSF